MDKEQENQFKENIKEIARLELKNSFNNNLMETLNSAFIFKYVDTLEKQSQKYKEVIDKAVKYIDDLRDESAERQGFYNCFPDDLYIPDINKLLDILKEVSE